MGLFTYLYIIYFSFFLKFKMSTLIFYAFILNSDCLFVSDLFFVTTAVVEIQI